MCSDLALYVIDGCGYCEDVRAACRELGVEIEERNIGLQPEHERALFQARGSRTVPVLRVGQDHWMPESADIIAYLYERFGEPGQTPPVRFGPPTQILMWGLLLGGVLAYEPARWWLWAAACAVGAARSFVYGWRRSHWVHAATGGAFAFGAVSIALYALGLAELPWWYVAFVVAIVVVGRPLVQRLRARTPR